MHGAVGRDDLRSRRHSLFSNQIVSFDTIDRVSRPPFVISPRVLTSYAAIERLIGRVEGLGGVMPQPLLRKRNRVRTVFGSVGIEGNTLSLGEVTAVLDGKRSAGSIREVREVQNAVAAYERASQFRFTSERDLLAAHRLLMRGLAPDAGRFRSGNVGVWHGARVAHVAHVAPPPERVPSQVRSLLAWAKKAPEPRLIVACVVHYELQFIHPFSDGNGRVGRLWQHVGLLSVSDAFSFLPVESVIRDQQPRYYKALQQSDQAGDSTAFIEFSLGALRTALAEFVDQVRPARQLEGDRIRDASAHFGRTWFARADYLRLYPRLSTASASRDLAAAVTDKTLERQGDKRLARYRFRRRR